MSEDAAPTLSSGTGAWALALGAAGVMTIGLLIGMPANEWADTTPGPVAHTAVATTDHSAAPLVPVAPVAAVAPVWSEAPAVTKKPAVQTTAKPAAVLPAVTVVEPMPGLEKPLLRTADLAAAERPAPKVEQSALVTIAGCLESDDDKFRLTETTGASAPKSRSWKTGFLAKRPAAVAVVDASGVGLTKHAGERVSLTGTLVDRDMHVHSLKRLSTSCE